MTEKQAYNLAQSRSRECWGQRFHVFKNTKTGAYAVSGILMSRDFEGPLHSFHKGREYSGPQVAEDVK